MKEYFLLYKNFEYEDLLFDMSELMETCNRENIVEISKDDVERAHIIAGKFFELVGKYGFKGNIWRNFLAFQIANNENAFSLSCEINGNKVKGFERAVLNDFGIFKKFFGYDIKKIDDVLGIKVFELLDNLENEEDENKVYNRSIRDRIFELGNRLFEAKDETEYFQIVNEFYMKYGVGEIGLHKAFKVNADLNDKVVISPITHIQNIYLDDLIGYELQKKKLTENTEAFLDGKKANNVLLFGDSGTGKSSSIKAILNEYYGRGLRMIEIYKHQFKYLHPAIEQIKDRKYKFIIFMDDLSFEDYEIEYKYLKAIIEGGLAVKPDNVLIYATSNRRHLIREKWSDKEDRTEDLHTSDTVQEKLSLAARFGESIYYGAPDKKEFSTIVKGLAKKHNLNISEEKLLAEANKWEISHGGLSGRTATQFINHIAFFEKNNYN